MAVRLKQSGDSSGVAARERGLEGIEPVRGKAPRLDGGPFGSGG